MHKLMQLLGGKYEETFTPHVSVLICKEGNSNTEKTRVAEAADVPVVGWNGYSAFWRMGEYPPTSITGS